MKLPNADSLFFSVDLKDYTEGNEKLTNVLALLKGKKREAKENELTGTYVRIMNEVFEILPNGSRFHAYILHNDHYEIKIAKVRSKNDNNYPISVRVKSAALWNVGLFPAYYSVMEFINKNIGPVKSEKISRLDLCVHTDELEFNVEDINNFSGRYKKETMYFQNRNVSGFVFGTFTNKTIMARIYNKALEVKTKKKKLWFFDIWQKNNMDIDSVWNVEFQLGRELFKEFGMESVMQVLEHIESLWDYCTNWLTYRVNDKTRKTNSDVTKVWETIQKSYINFVNVCQKQLISRVKQLKATAMAYLPQLFGLLSSFIATAPDMSLHYADKDNLSLRMLMKIKELARLHYHKKEISFSDEVKKKFQVISKMNMKYEEIYNVC